MGLGVTLPEADFVRFRSALHQGLGPPVAWNHQRLEKFYQKAASLVDSMSISGYPDRPGAYMKSVPGGTAGIARCWDLGIRE